MKPILATEVSPCWNYHCIRFSEIKGTSELNLAHASCTDNSQTRVPLLRDAKEVGLVLGIGDVR